MKPGKIYPSERHQQIQDSLMRLKEEKPSFLRRIVPFWKRRKKEKSQIDSSQLKTIYGKWLHKVIESLPFEPFLDDLAYIFNESGGFKVLTISIAIVSMITFLLDFSVRRQIAYYQAWNTINGAVGIKGDAGRKESIESLHKNRYNLAGLEIPGVHIHVLDLSPTCVPFTRFLCHNAYLGRSNLSKATLNNGDFSFANFSDADLSNAEIGNANLNSAILKKATLSNANLSNANLSNANLFRALLRFANFNKADLNKANLSKADLTNANFSGANLNDTNFNEAILLTADLRNSKKLTTEQLSGENQPYLCNVALPNSITDIDPNRDCEQIPQLLSNRYSWLSLGEAKQIVEEAQAKTWD